MEHPAAIPWTNYKPRERGILDLIDDILRLCAECRIQFSGGQGSVTETPLTGEEPRSFPFPFRNSLFRAIMARLGEPVLYADRAAFTALALRDDAEKRALVQVLGLLPP